MQPVELAPDRYQVFAMAAPGRIKLDKPWLIAYHLGISSVLKVDDLLLE